MADLVKGAVSEINAVIADRKPAVGPLRVGDDLEDAFAWKEERTLSQALTLQYDKVIFILEPSEEAKAAIGKRVTVIDHPGADPFYSLAAWQSGPCSRP